MLSERLTELFKMLQCSNTEIARFAGCSPSGISRIKRDQRRPKPQSRSMQQLSDGIYRYAEEENMLDFLAALCKTGRTDPEALIPALISWLYDDGDFPRPPAVNPRSKQKLLNRTAHFGELLDKSMRLLELSNIRLASALNVDVSLISRYRNGDLYPARNERIKETLCEILLERAEKMRLIPQLSALFGTDADHLNKDSLRTCLFESEDAYFVHPWQSLLNSIETFTPGSGLPAGPLEIPPIQPSDRYWGTDGLRKAVIRFLSEGACSGGTLLLYSDEPLEWMSEDPEYFALWKNLMLFCLNSNVHIKIIHNVDRSTSEMFRAITGWFPLYMSGMIEPYALHSRKNTRFRHTMFLHPGHSCISGFFPEGAGENRWYDYMTDRARLTAAESGFHSMLEGADCFLKAFPVSQADHFRNIMKEKQPENPTGIMSGFSAMTMPGELLENILARAGTNPDISRKISRVLKEQKEMFYQSLKRGTVNDIIYLPGAEAIRSGTVPVNMDADLTDAPLFYTAGEFSLHLLAVQELLEKEPDYHLTILPFSPFQNIQIIILENAVVVLMRQKPHTAFIFTNELLTKAVSAYADSLVSSYAQDRDITLKKLRHIREML